MQVLFTLFIVVSTVVTVQAVDFKRVGRACNPPPVNTAALNLIKQFEVFNASPKPDATGKLSVGYRHLCQQPNCAEVKFKFPLTQADATTLLQTDLKPFTKCFSDDINDKVKLNDNQFGALASWAFNEECGNVKSSNLVKRLNAGEDPNRVAASELPHWNTVGGGSHLDC